MHELLHVVRFIRLYGGTHTTAVWLAESAYGDYCSDLCATRTPELSLLRRILSAWSAVLLSSYLPLTTRIDSFLTRREYSRSLLGVLLLPPINVASARYWHLGGASPTLPQPQWSRLLKATNEPGRPLHERQLLGNIQSHLRDPASLSVLSSLEELMPRFPVGSFGVRSLVKQRKATRLRALHRHAQLDGASDAASACSVPRLTNDNGADAAARLVAHEQVRLVVEAHAAHAAQHHLPPLDTTRALAHLCNNDLLLYSVPRVSMLVPTATGPELVFGDGLRKVSFEGMLGAASADSGVQLSALSDSSVIALNPATNADEPALIETVLLTPLRYDVGGRISDDGTAALNGGGAVLPWMPDSSMLLVDEKGKAGRPPRRRLYNCLVALKFLPCAAADDAVAAMVANDLHASMVVRDAHPRRVPAEVLAGSRCRSAASGNGLSALRAAGRPAAPATTIIPLSFVRRHVLLFPMVLPMVSVRDPRKLGLCCVYDHVMFSGLPLALTLIPVCAWCVLCSVAWRERSGLR